jgi:septum formation protein
MLILASRSEARKTLLSQAGFAFSVVLAGVDEREIEAGTDGHEVPLLLAQRKAEAVSLTYPGALVIGADQTLALGTTLLHKPADLNEAAAQLDLLRGRTHRLHAAVALVRDGELLWSDVQSADLTMRNFSPTERDTVLALEGDAVLHSVGGYRLEGPSIRLFETISGDYFTILGLPLLPLIAALRQFAPELSDGA